MAGFTDSSPTLLSPGSPSLANTPHTHPTKYCLVTLPQERLERRKVHEQLQVLRGNIRVCCRVRPCFRWDG